MSRARPSLTFACVYNDEDTLRECLAASLARISDAPDMELITVDNRDHSFASAGAALNHAVRLSTKEVVVMAHQDAYVHSPDLIRETARHLWDGTFGLLGPVGVDSAGFVVGRMRDRTALIGRPSPEPTAVDSLDEVLMMARREVLLEHPITEDADLSWHAYGVELSARLRRSSIGTAACDMAVTHNSRNLNLARLEDAHARIAELNPDVLPLRTTCGTIGDAPAPRASMLRRARRLAGRKRRALLIRVRQARARQSRPPQVDLRETLQDLAWTDHPLAIINVDAVGRFDEQAGGTIRLTRDGRPVTFAAVGGVDEALRVIEAVPEDQSALVTNLSVEDLSAIRRAGRRHLLGGYAGEYWLLFGPIVDTVPPHWFR
ncbi:glycosyltransferase family 2 protein [Nocardioides KLBMP 9356]|uniref:Glycosyltransferase family 2 protein n=1 Tax=Nocardioides potassii TaxID=2911371 RepID=A0ABS9H8D1_9ACTN|nr:glycosyltransferase family A protein [Nocardioides potassii]MCF6376283.1 glycosyltransferase family 2 protein [Nocardioides potassii]